MSNHALQFVGIAAYELMKYGKEGAGAVVHREALVCGRQVEVSWPLLEPDWTKDILLNVPVPQLCKCDHIWHVRLFLSGRNARDRTLFNV